MNHLWRFLVLGLSCYFLLDLAVPNFVWDLLFSTELAETVIKRCFPIVSLGYFGPGNGCERTVASWTGLVLFTELQGRYRLGTAVLLVLEVVSLIIASLVWHRASRTWR